MPNIAKASTTRRVINSKIRGVGLDTDRFVFHETPTPTPDGAQTVFTTANAYLSGSLQVYLDGLQQIKTTDYTETTSTTFTMVTAPASDETLKVTYIKST